MEKILHLYPLLLLLLLHIGNETCACKAKLTQSAAHTAAQSAAASVGTGVVRAGAQIYSIARQIPVVTHIMKSIRRHLDEVISSTDEMAPRTKKLVDDIDKIITKGLTEGEGISGFNTAASKLRSLKTEQLFQHIFFNNKDKVIDDIVDVLENAIKRQRVEKIIDGVESADTVGNEMGSKIASSISRLNSMEKLRSPITLEELLKPAAAVVAKESDNIYPGIKKFNKGDHLLNAAEETSANSKVQIITQAAGRPIRDRRPSIKVTGDNWINY